MNTTVNSDMVIYNRLAQTSYLERMQDNLQLFNGASANALVLRTEAIEGDFDKSAFYTVPGGMAHRNVNSTAAVTSQKLGSDEDISVKTPWKYGPYASTEEAFKRRARSPEEFYALIGQHQADAFMDYAIQVAFASLDAAIGTVAALNVSDTIAASGKKTLTKGLRTFGDASNRIGIWGMSSGVYFDYVDEAIDNKVYEEAGVVIYGGTPGTMGKPVLVSDKIAANKVYGLQPGAVEVVESQAPESRAYPINDQENLANGYRAEGAFNVDLLGYKFTGTENPDLTALGAGGNWSKVAQSNKATAGFVIDLSGD
ncbi:MAG: major capsid protein [Pseudomonadota bacterium]|nr:major capsid protein [Pseudomonadota bacterium]